MVVSGQNQISLVLDSTYLLPAFGVDIGEGSNIVPQIVDTMTKSAIKLFISDLTPLECFLKAFRIAERSKREEGKKSAKIGFIATTKDPSITIISHLDEDIIAEASLIRESHKDPFDCFIFATARVLQASLLTEDQSAEKYLPKKIVSLADLKKML